MIKVKHVPKNAKVEYVKSQTQTREHICHFPGCGKQCKPAYWGCYGCWMKLPKYLRDKIWDTYTIGQEVSMTPTREYLDITDEVDKYIFDNLLTSEDKQRISDGITRVGQGNSEGI